MAVNSASWVWKEGLFLLSALREAVVVKATCKACPHGVCICLDDVRKL